MKKTILLIIVFATQLNFSNAQWVVQDLSSITTEGFAKVFFSDSLKGWVSGLNGTIIHTSNGGINWTLQNSGATGYLRDIYFVDSLKGWAISSYGEILKTNNSGTNWSHQNLTGEFIYIHFFDSLYGLTANRNGIIYKSYDGGQNWTAMQGSLPVNTIRSYFALDSLHSWGVGNTCIYKYNGTNWTQKYYSGSQDFYSVYFVDSLKGWAVGTTSSSGLIMKTTDGGNSWNQQTINMPTGYLFSVYFLDSINGWSVGDYGKVFKYNGTNWLEQNSNIAQQLSSVYFNDLNHGWATSWGGKLIHTNFLTNNFGTTQNIASDYSVYPNPAKNKILINSNWTFQNSILSIYNIQGQLLLQQPIKQEKTELDISRLAKGIYILKLTDFDNIEMTKFVKE